MVYAVMIALMALQVQGQSGGEKADTGVDLAKKLSNPVANLISVPLQYNYDENMGPNEEGSISKLNIQPVIPLTLNKDWNLITRTIVPLVDQDDLPVKGQGDSGLGDTTASQFFSPKEPTANGWIWGAGPVEYLPTASEDTLGAEKWGLGPTVVVLKQDGPWTVGGLANHIWSVTGDDDRSDINATYLQPFVTYNTKTKTTLSLNTESTYDWESEEWSVPVNAMVSQLFKVGSQIMQFGLGARYWAESTEYGPEDWGLRVQLTFLFPE